MENSNLNVVAALLAGAVAGTVIGLLFAPQKGQETRDRVMTGAKELAEDLKRKVRGEIPEGS